MIDDILRMVEKDVDLEFKNYEIGEENVDQAIWYLLTYAAEEDLRSTFGAGNGFYPDTVSMVNSLRYVASWAYSLCSEGREISLQMTESSYDKARSFFKLAREYLFFVSAYTFASKGIRQLRLNERTIETVEPLYSDLRYEAYSHMIQCSNSNFKNICDLSEIVNEINADIVIKKNGFHLRNRCQHSRAAYPKVLEYISDLSSVPKGWDINGFSIKEFTEFTSALVSISLVHYSSHLRVWQEMGVSFGSNNALLIMNADKLAKEIFSLSRLPISKCRIILKNSFYKPSLKACDPALQPLFLIRGKVVIFPGLILSLNHERNVLALMNRVPDLRKKYSLLTSDKENLMRQRITKALCGLGLRFEYGQLLSSNTDVDLAIIDDKNHYIFFAEMKNILEPDDPLECINRDKDLKKGVIQAHKLRNIWLRNPPVIYDRFGVTEEFDAIFLVLSANWIGSEWIQDDSIPIINEKHFVDYLYQFGSIKTQKWLRVREYLPVEDVHFKSCEVISQVGRWKLKHNCYYLTDRKFL